VRAPADLDRALAAAVLDELIGAALVLNGAHRRRSVVSRRFTARADRRGGARITRR